MRKHDILVLLMVLLCFIGFLAAPAAEADGLRADTLTINVGYYGGPYYEKKVFTVSDLESLGVKDEVYTLIGDGSSIVTAHARGVLLEDIINAAGIDLGSVKYFHFCTRDYVDDYFTSIPKRELLDTQRYVYPQLPYKYDYDTRSLLPGATEGGRLVPTMMALQDDWRRWTAPLLEGMFDPNNFSNLIDGNRFRLYFGQTDFKTNTTGRAAKFVHTIEVELAGYPSLKAGVSSVLELEVGSEYRLTVRVSAADPVLEDAISKRLQWSSDDTQVAAVDSSGKISMRGEGSAVITASYGDQKVTFQVRSSKKDEKLEPPKTEEEEEKKEEKDNEKEEEEEKEKSPGGFGFGDGGPGGMGSGNNGTSGNIYTLEKNAKGMLIAKPGEGVNSKPESGGNTGAVQNWRMFEMADTAIELPIIEEENPLMTFMAVAALILFFSGMGGETIWFLIQR